MEGIPRVPMLAPDIKIAAAPMAAEFSTRIKQYIAEHYMADPSQFDGALNEIEDMRNQICRFISDTETICVMKRYYAQMVMVKMRFPMEEGDPVAVPFAWLDRTLEMPTPAVFDDINFELACIMYNIGSIHGHIGMGEGRVDLDSIKNAFMQFQLAAWPLKFLRDEMNLTKFQTMDFENAILTWYINLLLNQAQECILEKSMIDHKKNATVATIAFFLRDSYHSCSVHLENSSVSEVVSSSKFKEWLRTCDVKSNLYNAIGHLYMGMQADEEQKMGLRLAHYNVALDRIKAAMKTAEKDKRESLRQSVLFALEVIAGKQANALKENDFIYHDRVPKYEDLELPDGKSLIKPIAFDPHDKSVLGEDLFAQLLPVTVIRSVSVYEEEKTKLKRKIGDKIAKKDEELDEYLLSLELGQINVDTEMDKLSLPAELLEASARFCSQPDAFAEILNKLYEVGDRSNLVEKTLKDLRVRVDSIDLPEVTSDDGYKAISRTLDQYQEMHSKYRDSNSDYQSAIAEQSELIRMLAMPLTELKKKLVGTVPKLDESEDGRTLKRILDKVDEMRMQRIKLYENFKGDLLRDDISGKLLADKHEDNKNLFDSELYKHDMNIALIEQNLTAQENILRALTEANAKYANVRQEAIEMAQKRSEQISELVNAYEVFTLVTNQAGKGMKFYDQLLTKSGGLAQSIQAMESMCQKEKERKRERQQKAEEKMRAMQLAKDTDETMAFFSTGSLNEHPAAFPAAPRPVLADKTSRPRLGDYMDFYRNKMGSVPSTPAVAPMKNGAQLPPKSYAAFGASLQPMANAYASQGYQMPANYYQQPMVPSSNAGNPSHIPTMFSASTNAPGISTSTPLQFPMPSLSAIGNPQLALPNRTPLPQPPTMPGTQFSMYQSPFAAPTGPQQPQFGNPSPFSATQNSGAINVSSNSPWHQNFPTNTRLQ